MGKEIPLGRIAGIRVGMHVAFLLLAGLFGWSLSQRLPNLAPGHAPAAYWAAGFCGAVLLLISVLVHEVGHALVARDEGIVVRSMGLTPLGGVTRMETSPKTPGAELRVSIVGPIASATCGLVLLCVAYVIPDGGLGSLAGHVTFYLGVVNLGLAVLNAIPASPLDGGRVLASLIWMRTGSQVRAMRWAAWAGVAVGSAATVYGLLEIRAGRPVPWGWPMLVTGGFLVLSAIRELQAAPVYALLDGVTVAQGMAPATGSVPGWVTVGDFLRRSAPAADDPAWPVIGEDGRVSGLLTATAVRALPHDRYESTRISAVALPLDRIGRADPGEPLLGALQRLESTPGRHAVVADAAGTVIGTLDPGALHRAITARRSPGTPALAGPG